MDQQDILDKEDRKDRISEASIWILFAILSLLIFSLTVYKNMGEVVLKYNGNKITATFKEKSDFVMIKKEDGSNYIINIGGTLPSHRANEIDLYYYGDDVTKAVPLTQIWFWLLVEFFFGGIAILCFHLARKNLKRTTHSYT